MIETEIIIILYCMLLLAADESTVSGLFATRKKEKTNNY